MKNTVIRALTFAVLLGATALAVADSPVFDIARLGSGKEMEKLLAADVKQVHARTALGSTPLHLAATNISPGALKILIAKGADVNARDSDGVTPLHMAAFADKAEAAKLLLGAGANPSAKDDKGATPQDFTDRAQSTNVKAELVMWMLNPQSCKQGKTKLSSC